MTTFLSLLRPQPFQTPPYPLQTQNPFQKAHCPYPRTHFRPGPQSLVVAKFGFLNSGQIPDPGTIKELFGRAEGLLYTIADAAVNSSDVVAGTDAGTQQNSNGDWLSGITSSMETVLKVLKNGLSTLHVPYSYGFAIILLTILVKAATFPLSKKQVESAMAMRSLAPQIKAIQERYAGDPEKIQLETARLYKLAGINPLAGCLPTLATIPVWIGLYRALSNVANEGLLTEGFFWIPSLAGPTTVAARQSGSGISWLFPFVDGHPPLGWSDTAAYLVLPVLLIVSQYISIQIMQSSQSNDPNMKSSQAITNFLPLMIGYFALSVPSGLSLYWLTNNILSTGQQVWLQKMGGAKNPVGQLNVDISKEEQSPPQQNVFEAKSVQTETKPTQTEEVSPPTGLRPGERFKLLKEEEARRKRQLEEAKMQTAAGARNAAPPVRKEGHEPTNNGTSLNGNVNGEASKEQDNTSDLPNENGTATSMPEEETGKEAVEVHSRLSSVDRSSGEETS